jgi:hypothetical protein
VTKYRLSENEKIDYPVVHNSMRRLEKRSLVKEVGRTKGETGVETIRYDVTELGIWALLIAEGVDIPRLAKKRAMDLIYFERWQALGSNMAAVKHVLHIYARTRLMVAELEGVDPLGHLPHEISLASALYGIPMRVLSPDDRERFFLAHCLDDKLAEFYYKSAKRVLHDLESMCDQWQIHVAAFQRTHDLAKQMLEAGEPYEKVERLALEAVKKGFEVRRAKEKKGEYVAADPLDVPLFGLWSAGETKQK